MRTKRRGIRFEVIRKHTRSTAVFGQCGLTTIQELLLYDKYGPPVNKKKSQFHGHYGYSVHATEILVPPAQE